jgi:hypothetical protein
LRARRAIAIAASVACSAPWAGAADDLQLWSELALEAPIGSRFRAGLRQELRVYQDPARLGLYNYDLGVAWVRSEGLAFSLHFLQEFDRSDGAFETESRPYADALVRATLRGAELSNRVRVELRLFEEGEDRVRLRERVQLVLPWALGRGGPRPFVSEELLFETEGRGFDQNRAMLGLVARRGTLTATVYGLLLSREDGGWDHTPVAGLSLTWSVGGRPMMTGEH